MQIQKRGAKIKGKTFYDLEAVFVPPSLIESYDCMIKRSKALRNGLLGMNALSGRDTVSYTNGRGKVSALRVLAQTDID